MPQDMVEVAVSGDEMSVCQVQFEVAPAEDGGKREGGVVRV
jgi:hypothetical protein